MDERRAIELAAVIASKLGATNEEMIFALAINFCSMSKTMDLTAAARAELLRRAMDLVEQYPLEPSN